MARQRETQPSQRVVALDRQNDGDDVRVMLERRGDGYQLSTTGDFDGVPLVRVAPWERSLVRCRGVDDLPVEELASVLQILGDGELPERVPAHRRGCGAVPVEGQGRTALLTAWMPTADESGGVDDGSMYSTAPAALGLAVSLAEGCVFGSDAQSGVLIVAARGPEGMIVRSLRESPDVVATDAHVEQRLREAATAVGLHEDEVRSTLRSAASPWEGRRVGWSPEIGASLSRLVRGWSETDSQASRTFVAVCAGMLAVHPDGTVRALASLRRDQPAERKGVGDRVNSWLSSRRHVVLACIVCLLVLLFAPLLSAKAREMLLTSKVGRAEALRERYEADARLSAIYGQLNERVWPMSKMLAEVSAAAPVHVVLESVRMDSNAQIDIEGFVQVAPGGPTLENPPETLLTRYESALNELGTLGSVTVVRREIVGDSVEFQVTARVRNATARGNLPMDFADMPLAEVLYGEGASNTATPIVAAASTSTSRGRPSGPSSARSTEERASRDGAIEGGRDASGDRRPTSERGPASVDGVPTPISDADIAALDRGELLNQWRIRNSASRDEKNDAETRARLKEEADKLIARYREVGSGG